MPDAPIGRREAVRTLERERAEALGLIDGLAPRLITRRAIGRGKWSPKDVIGHLATWEGWALEALEHWDHGAAWPRDAELWTRGVNPMNVAELERVRKLSAPEVRRRAEATHRELIDRLASMSNARWNGPATARGRTPLGARLGSILGGPAGPFRHGEAHLRDLRTFAARNAST
jgi:hypothetical protein